jgi:hypothetical protein
MSKERLIFGPLALQIPASERCMPALSDQLELLGSIGRPSTAHLPRADGRANLIFQVEELLTNGSFCELASLSYFRQAGVLTLVRVKPVKHGLALSSYRANVCWLVPGGMTEPADQDRYYCASVRFGDRLFFGKNAVTMIIDRLPVGPASWLETVLLGVGDFAMNRVASYIHDQLATSTNGGDFSKHKTRQNRL